MAKMKEVPVLEESEDLKALIKRNEASRPTARKFIVAVLSALVIGLGAYMLLGGNLNQLMKIADFASQSSEQENNPRVNSKSSFYVAMPVLTVNLINNNGQDAFLKVAPVLEYSQKDLSEIIAERRPRLVDSFTSVMRNLRVTDLKGSAGTQLLREELTRRANLALYPYEINAVRFEEIIIQ